jgi:magnesium and cobalt transporter
MQIFDGLLGNSVSNRNELIEVLKKSANNNIIEKDSIPIIEAILNIDNLRAKDIMIPRMDMDIIDINDSIEVIIDKISTTGHSRFPVIDEEISNVLGVLHSKDLIPYLIKREEINIRDLLREAYFIPEIKHLDGLMYEMRIRQSHMAIVVDEFTNVVGLITLEMIVEQILGEIEDEHDSVEGEREILLLGPNSYRVKGHCRLNQFNTTLGLEWTDTSIETVGGFLVKFLGRIPIIGEILDFEKVKIEIINSDSRKINLLLITLK